MLPTSSRPWRIARRVLPAVVLALGPAVVACGATAPAPERTAPRDDEPSTAPTSPHGESAAAAHDHALGHVDGDGDDGDADDAALRAVAKQSVTWWSPLGRRLREPARVKVLGINDFHGQLSAGRRSAGRPVGGAAVLASYLKAASAARDHATLVVHAGDHVGASPPASALLQDEPAIQFLNLLANDFCRYELRLHPRCNVVGTLGNHELDEGKDEMLRLVFGGNSPKGPSLEPSYRGARFPYVSANVVDARSGVPVLPPFVVKILDGVPVGVIGAILEGTPSVVTADGVAGLRFLNEAQTINKYVRVLKAMGIRAIVVTLHQGGSQSPYGGATNGTTADGAPTASVSGPIVDIVRRLDDEVDVVVSGHSHSFTNALLETASGKKVLVTQAFSASTAFADIDLTVDRRTGDVVGKTARIVTTYADEGPGAAPDAKVSALVAEAEARTAPLVGRVVATASADVAAAPNEAGEAPLGNLIADAQRAATGADIALMNPGGIRASLAAGPVTWGALFTVQPFGNALVTLSLTGSQLRAVLEQQWANGASRILQIAGFSYTWDAARPVGSRIVEMRRSGAPIEETKVYRVTANQFLAAGGDGFTALTDGVDAEAGPIDLDALLSYVASLPQPFTSSVEGRIQRRN